MLWQASSSVFCFRRGGGGGRRLGIGVHRCWRATRDGGETDCGHGLKGNSPEFVGAAVVVAFLPFGRALVLYCLCFTTVVGMKFGVRNLEV